MLLVSDYEEVFRASVDRPEEFWLQAANRIDWSTAPTRALDSANVPFYRWFPDGELNISSNCLDRHVAAGRGEQAALIYDSPVTGTGRTFSYRELLAEVALFAGVLAGLGVGKGDRVVIYLPMVPEAVIAMLACARIGAVHSVVFGGFAAKELAVRIDDAEPVVIVSASCGIEGQRVLEYKPLLDEAIRLAAHKPREVDHPAASAGGGSHGRRRRRLVGGDGGGDTGRTGAGHSTDPLYILYTSGTTGKPKGVVRDTGGYAVALAWTMPNVYDVGPGEVLFTASDVGWVVGHSYIVYAPLLVGATSVIYEGKPVGTPDAGQFWRVVQHYRVKSLFTAPTAFRAIRKADPKAELLAGYDLSSLKYLFLAGERLDPETYHWAGDVLGIPVIDHWWQTETGWPIVANPAGIELLPIKPGSPTRPLPGWDVQVLDPSGDRGAGRHRRRHRGQTADAAGSAAHPVARRRALRRAPTCPPTRVTT